MEGCDVVISAASDVELLWRSAVVISGERRDELVGVGGGVLDDHEAGHPAVNVAKVIELSGLGVLRNGDLDRVRVLPSLLLPLVLRPLEDWLVDVQTGNRPVVPILVRLAVAVDAVKRRLLDALARVAHELLFVALAWGRLLELRDVIVGAVRVVGEAQWVEPVGDVLLDEGVLDAPLDVQGRGDPLAPLDLVLVLPEVHLEHELVVRVRLALLSGLQGLGLGGVRRPQELARHPARARGPMPKGSRVRARSTSSSSPWVVLLSQRVVRRAARNKSPC